MKHTLSIFFLINFSAAGLVFTSCTVKSPEVAPAPQASFSASWEKNHSERKVWTEGLLSQLSERFASFDKASDAKFFCPSYAKLSKDQKLQMWVELFVWTSETESSWNPASSSVDVGNPSDINTYSVGLMQMSVVDQENYGFKFGYTYSDLKDAVKNLNLASAIMAHQIDKRGKILIAVGEPGLYWATLHPGGRYDKSKYIAGKVQGALSFCK